MRFWKIGLACICLLGLTQPAWSQKTEEAAPASSQKTEQAAPAPNQKTEAPAEHGILGYLDPRTGAFKPMAKAPAEESESETEVAATAGDFKVTVNITVKSPLIPSAAPVSCTFTASVFDNASMLNMFDEMTVAATGSGASRTCTLDMFYSWPLSSPGTDTVTLNYTVSAGPTGSGTFQNRYSSQSLPSLKSAPSGTTTKTINATI